jgi:hypothetical protein
LIFFHFHAGNKFLSILIGVGEVLVQDLEIRFPARGVMDELGIVYP